MTENNNIPKHWQIKKLGEVCEIIMGQSPPSTTYNYEEIGLPFFQGKAEFTELYPKVNKWCSEPNKIALPNDVLLSVRAPVGTTNIAIQKCCIGRGLAAIRYKNFKYVFYFLRSIEQQLDKKGTGTTFRAISGETIRTTEIPIPPQNEQQLIVSKIEELLSDLDNGKQQLLLAQQQLKIYHQSLLKWAFEGIDKNTIVNVEECCSHIVDCLHSTAKFSQSGFYCVDTTCIENGRILFERIRYVDKKTYFKRISRLKPQEGDILFSREGTVGTTLIVPQNIEICLGQRMMMFRLTKEILPKYFMYYFLSPTFKSQYQPLIMGTTAPHLNIRDIRKFKVLLCPLKEQQLIVDELESKLTVCDKIEETISQSLLQADSLRQSILKKAFEGKLV